MTPSEVAKVAELEGLVDQVAQQICETLWPNLADAPQVVDELSERIAPILRTALTHPLPDGEAGGRPVDGEAKMREALSAVRRLERFHGGALFAYHGSPHTHASDLRTIREALASTHAPS